MFNMRSHDALFAHLTLKKGSTLSREALESKGFKISRLKNDNKECRFSSTRREDAKTIKTESEGVPKKEYFT